MWHNINPCAHRNHVHIVSTVHAHRMNSARSMIAFLVRYLCSAERCTARQATTPEKIAIFLKTGDIEKTRQVFNKLAGTYDRTHNRTIVTRDLPLATSALFFFFHWLKQQSVQPIKSYIITNRVLTAVALAVLSACCVWLTYRALPARVTTGPTNTRQIAIIL